MRTVAGENSSSSEKLLQKRSGEGQRIYEILGRGAATSHSWGQHVLQSVLGHLQSEPTRDHSNGPGICPPPLFSVKEMLTGRFAVSWCLKNNSWFFLD